MFSSQRNLIKRSKGCLLLLAEGDDADVYVDAILAIWDSPTVIHRAPDMVVAKGGLRILLAPIDSVRGIGPADEGYVVLDTTTRLTSSSSSSSVGSSRLSIFSTCLF